VTQSGDQKEQAQVFRTLSEAGLVEIGVEEFPERLADVKRLVMTHLRELLDLDRTDKERESAAYSLGTLKGLELKLKGKAAPETNPSD
jgi:hypothetical protein